VEIRILGPTEVRHDGSPVALRGAKPRQLLNLLALSANRPVPTEKLIEDLWEAEPPPSAASALRVHFGRLRAVLEPDRHPSTPSFRLPAGPHGYLLRLEPEELDTDRFQRRILGARHSSADGYPARAVPQLTDALDLWRGPALTDVRDLSAARAEILRLDELHGTAFEELGEARLALGEHALVVDVLTSAVQTYPLREKLTSCLMLALYRTDRAADALRAFTILAKRLDDELGVPPSKALRKLEEDILLQRPTLDFVPHRAAVPVPLHLHPPVLRMIGRHEDLRNLVAALEESPDKRPRLHMVTGPAGIGKTTVINEFCARIERQGRRAFVGSCELHSSEPYEPISQLFRQIAECQGSDEFGRMERGVSFHPGGNPLLPSVPEADGATARFRLFEAASNWLSCHCTDATVVVIEDLHWADRPTLLLLRHLLRHRSLARTPFVGTYRDDDISGERLELVQCLAPPSRYRVQVLRPFHDSEVRSLVETIAPPENVGILDEHSAALRDATNGNPFFLRELLRELDDESIKLTKPADLFVALSSIAPAGVRPLVHRRMERLTGLGRILIYAAATLSEEISTTLLADVCDLTPDTVLDAIEECLATRLLVEDIHAFDRYLFPHALVRNAVYASIPEPDRLELHRQVAGALVRQSDENVRIAAIARHFCEAAPLGLENEAAKYAELAGAEAERHLLFSQAAEWYRQAIQWFASNHDDVEVGNLYLALGRAYANDKQVDRANDAFMTAADAARRSGDSALLIEVALAADGPWISGSEFRVLALSLLEEALENLDQGDDQRRVRALVRMASVLYYVDPEREERVVRQAIELSSALRDPEAIANAALAWHRCLTHDPTARGKRLALSRSACGNLVLTASTGKVYLLLQRELLADLLENGQLAAFQTVLAEYEGCARQLGSPADIYWSMALRATEATLHGDLAAAEQLARGAALRGYELEQLSEGAFLLQRFVIRYQQARLAEEVPILREASKAHTVFRAGAALAAIALSETGHQDRATEIAWETLGPDGGQLPCDVFWLAAVALFGGVAARGQDRRLQQLVARLLAPSAEHIVVFGVGGAVLGSAHYWLGLLASAMGYHDRAIDHLACAKTVAHDIDAPYWAAQAEMEASRVLAARGLGEDLNESARLAHKALAMANEYGFGRILRQATEPYLTAGQVGEAPGGGGKTRG
jgi:DNA-binding SARP family transcriptional activator